MSEIGPVTYEKCPAEGVQWHPAADIFPWIEGAEFDELVADIAERGIVEPIVFLDSQVLDGRNRYMAARKLGIEYPRVDYTGDDPVGFVLSKNLMRRHLTTGQRAMVATKIAKLPRGTNQHTARAVSSPSQAQIGAAVGVSQDSLQRARQVDEAGAEELVQEVTAGRVPLKIAAEIASLPKEDQQAVLDEVAKSENGKKTLRQVTRRINAERQEAKRQRKAENRTEFAGGTIDDLRRMALSGQKFGFVYADPPWRYETYSEAGQDRSASQHYGTMSLKEIEAMPVKALAADNCLLGLWTTRTHLRQSFDVIDAWGFEYVSILFVLVKQNPSGEGWHMGNGHWTRANAEICLLAKRGNPVRLDAGVSELIVVPREPHSAKPEEARARIMRLVDGPYIELFARQQSPNWCAWGDQVPPPEVAA